ncbi:DUF2971 domain-containing protein [Pandoraea oxalativorans]|uniref:DUF2971 domain-containing protein n=1 Tax=Pandoraea oxalativorans TaxID=573737 RepID=A0A0G3IHC8_9BURK|nr:DUF2971 domain-containing protein [Pandoraea oxalativorans]AKK24570.1 hypothetical protein MB84_27290 [Pandoraea oxalativorans]
MTLPDILYKYTSPKSALAVLESSRLRWAAPHTFNDIGEYQRMPCFEPSIADSYEAYVDRILDVAYGIKASEEVSLSEGAKALLHVCRMRAAQGTKRSWSKALVLQDRAADPDGVLAKGLRAFFQSPAGKTHLVLCLTGDPSNEVMWGTYAGEHAGCVLGFRHLPERGTPLLGAKPVVYTNHPYVSGSGLDFLLFGQSPAHLTAAREAVWYTKTPRWSYEEEWRVVTARELPADTEFQHFLFYPEELESITFCARAASDFVEQVRAIQREKYPHSRLFHMTADAGCWARTVVS